LTSFAHLIYTFSKPLRAVEDHLPKVNKPSHPNFRGVPVFHCSFTTGCHISVQHEDAVASPTLENWPL